MISVHSRERQSSCTRVVRARGMCAFSRIRMLSASVRDRVPKLASEHQWFEALARSRSCAGIEEIGVQTEDPFGVLPLEAIANTAHTNIIELVKRAEATRKLSDVCNAKHQREIDMSLFNISSDGPRPAAWPATPAAMAH